MFVLASLHGDARDVLLSQVTLSFKEMFALVQLKRVLNTQHPTIPGPVNNRPLSDTPVSTAESLPLHRHAAFLLLTSLQSSVLSYML